LLCCGRPSVLGVDILPPTRGRAPVGRRRWRACSTGRSDRRIGAPLSVPLGPLPQRGVLLLLRKLQMFLAEEPESRSFRPVLATRVMAAHVELAAAELARDSISGVASTSRRSEHCGNALREEVRESLDQGIEWVGRPSGHDTTYP